MDAILKGLLATACVVVIVGGGYFGLAEYQARELEKSAQRIANDPAVRVCEAVIQKRLKSPASYKLVEAHLDGGMVRIAYDAVNSYNAPLRGSHICKFTLDADRQNFLFAGSGDIEKATTETSRLADEIKAASDAGTFAARKREFDRKIADQLKETARTIGLAVLDNEAAKATGLHPIPASQTALQIIPE